MTNCAGTKRNRRLKWIALSAACLCPQAILLAADSWNDGDGNWSVPANWNPANVPAAGDTVNITETDGVSRTITYDYTGAAVTLNSLTLNLTNFTGTSSTVLAMSANNLTAANETIGNSGAGTFDQIGGANTVGTTLAIGHNTSGTGAYYLSGTGSLAVSANEYVAQSGEGTFIQRGGTNTINSGANLMIGYNSTAVGNYYVTDGALVADTALIVGESGTGTFVQTGGSVSVNGAISDGVNVYLGLVLGDKASSTGFYALSAGTLSVTDDEMIGEASTGIFTQNGGTNTCLGNVVVGHINGGNGIYDLSGGLAQFGGLVVADYGHATASFVLSGTGTLAVSGNEGIGTNENSKPTTIANLTQTGGINTTGSLAMGNSQNATGSYDLSGGTLTVNGALTLTGPNSAFSATGGTATAASVVNDGGSLTLSPAAGTAGNLAVTGTFSQSAGATLVQGTLSAVGGLTISGGLLQIGGRGVTGPVTGPISGSVAGNIVNNASVSVQCGAPGQPTTLANITGIGTLCVGTALTPAFVQLAPGGGISSQSSLLINPGSTLDITNNSLAINYTAGSDPAAAVQCALVSAYNSGNWQGPGLTSSLARRNPRAFAVGYVDNTATDQIHVMATVPGDCDLDGSTDFTDLSIVAQYFGSSMEKGNAVSWQTGDVNYDGSVNFGDLSIVAQYFGDSLTKAEAASLPASFVAQYDLALTEDRSGGGGTTNVPEPACIALLALAAGGSRRGRHALSK